MRQFLSSLLAITILLSASAGFAANAAKVDPALAQTYRSLASEVSADNLHDTIRVLSSNSTRVAGYPGCREAGKYITDQFRKLGLSDVKVEPFYATVPMDEGASLSIGGKSLRLYPLWPNYVRTSQLPKAGLSCPLIYGGMGKLSELDGQKVAGSAVLVEFNSGTDWLNAPRLGAKAVIFIEPDKTVRAEAEDKFLSIPISIPRFWISKSDGLRLKSMAQSGKTPQVHLKCRMPWKKQLTENITGIIHGTDPKLRNQVIIIESFYDSTSVVPSLAPGAEGACGISGMLELARIFKLHPPKRTILFVATSGHYQSLKGIREYLYKHFSELEELGPGAKMAASLSSLVHGKRELSKQKRIPVYLFAGLDLSSRTKGTALLFKSWFHLQRGDIKDRFPDIARVCRENAERVSQVLGYDPEKAFGDGVNMVGGKDWPNLIRGVVALDSEAVTVAGGLGISFVSMDDSRLLIDTPFDTVDKVNIENLRTQVRLLACLFHHILNDPNTKTVEGAPIFPISSPSGISGISPRGGFAELKGQVVRQNLKKGYIPNDPVKGCVVAVRHREKAKTLIGVRANMMEMVDENAKFSFRGVLPATASDVVSILVTHVDAFKMDEDSGEIIYSPDMGVFGADFYPTDIHINSAVKEVPIVVFNCRPTSVYDIIDPQTLKALPELSVFEGESNGRPASYGYSIAVPIVSNPMLDQRYSVEDMAVIFTPPNTKLKITMSDGAASDKKLVLINSTNRSKEGEGYLVGNGNSITNTPLMVAKDMWALDDYRMNRLKKYRIVNEGVESLHNAAKGEIRLAEEALSRNDYSASGSYAQAAWGYESRAYPDVQKTARDVVSGVLFYLALMLPFAYFCERLFFAFSDLKRQLTAAGAIFLVTFVIFRFSHPAFDITMNPAIVFIAFAMLALSALVVSLLMGKFEEFVRNLNKSTVGVHKADIGRMGIAAAAFSLGISNMRRRKARTLLTCTTLVVVTFIVLSCTSLVQTMRFNKVPAPGKPVYTGVMLRDPKWGCLQEPAYRFLNSEFHATQTVAPRSVFFVAGSTEPSVTVERGKKIAVLRGIAGFTPQENEVTHLGETLTAGRWFVPGEMDSIILPEKVAASLDVKKEDVGRAKVVYAGEEFTVIGLFDAEKYRQIKDLDGEMLTPVDFMMMMKQSMSSGTGGGSFSSYTHVQPETVALMPFDTVLKQGGAVRSIAISFSDNKELDTALQKLMHRLELNLYAGISGKIYRYSSSAATSGKGSAAVVVSLLIASLIVLNTMLGSVYERVKEIGIFSSLGLAPNHIAMLFIAEAMVYAILGAVAGYLVAQGTSKLMNMFGILPGLYLNFSSLSAVISTLIVVGVVLLSTIYPARKASQVATPAVQRKWKVADPEGDLWKITLPFAITGDQARGVNSFLSEWFKSFEGQSVGDMVTQGVCTSTFENEHSTGHRVECQSWLAPFDLGVSQYVVLEILPTDMRNVFEVNLTLTRDSGNVSDWIRVNRKFLNTVRKQFLIWRTLKAEDRDRYVVIREVLSSDGAETLG